MMVTPIQTGTIGSLSVSFDLLGLGTPFHIMDCFLWIFCLSSTID